MNLKRLSFCSVRLTLITLCLMASGLSMAAINTNLLNSKSHVGNWLLALKTGPLQWKQGDDINNTGFTFGYRLPEFEYGSISMELDFVNSTGGGEISEDSSGNPITAEASFQAYTGSAVYRSNGKIFIKGKMGYSQREIAIEFADFPELNDTDTQSAFSAGAGAGIRLGRNFELELEYTSYEQEQNFISLGLNWQFGKNHRQQVAKKDQQKVEQLYPRPKPKKQTVTKKKLKRNEKPQPPQAKPTAIEPMVIKKYAQPPTPETPSIQEKVEPNLPIGRSAYTAERAARADACRRPILQTKRNNWPYELYRAVCMDGSFRTVTCEWGQCKVIK